MTSTAVSKYRTSVKVSTATGATKTITAITKATAAVVTSAGHGLPVGTVGLISGVSGMLEINGMPAVITLQDTNTMTLGGIDSTTFTTYTSGGVFTPQTMTQVENVTALDFAPDEADEEDATEFMSLKKEYIIGLSGEGVVTIGVDIDPTGPGQERIRKLVGTNTAAVLSVTRSDAKTAAMVARFKSNPQSFPGKHSGSFAGRIIGALAWYA